MQEKNWWQDAVVYQIYPRSFMDSNNDGVGDIQGIIQKLDYLETLGINTIWLCPIFQSPMADNGYDISNYKEIHYEFGSLTDLETLIIKAKQKGIRILLDLVLNHSSDKHPWFQAALSDPSSPYRDYYIIRKGKNGNPPNNWRSHFGGSAWQKLPNSKDEYYLHLFAVEQPDFNWENQDLREALFEMITWWIKKGIAGFRIDAISLIKKNQEFPDIETKDSDGLASPLSECLNYPGIEDFLGEMRDKVFAPNQAYTVAEANGIPDEKLEAFIGKNGFFTNVFDFSYTDIDIKSEYWFDRNYFSCEDLKQKIFTSQKKICEIGYGAPYLENHDQNRSPNKYLNDKDIRYESITMLGIMYFFLQGIPYIYQGQEIGMTNYPWENIDQFNDVAAKDQYKKGLEAGLSREEAFERVAWRVRDNSRTPMLWDGTENAGFSKTRPWLPVHPDYAKINVELQQSPESEESVLNFYRKMIKTRKTFSPFFFQADLQPAFLDHKDIIAYYRQQEERKFLIICNFSSLDQKLDLPKATVVLSNYKRSEGTNTIKGNTIIRPFEGVLLEVCY